MNAHHEPWVGIYSPPKHLHGQNMGRITACVPMVYRPWALGWYVIPHHEPRVGVHSPPWALGWYIIPHHNPGSVFIPQLCIYMGRITACVPMVYRPWVLGWYIIPHHEPWVGIYSPPKALHGQTNACVPTMGTEWVYLFIIITLIWDRK